MKDYWDKNLQKRISCLKQYQFNFHWGAFRYIGASRFKKKKKTFPKVYKNPKLPVSAGNAFKE